MDCLRRKSWTGSPGDDRRPRCTPDRLRGKMRRFSVAPASFVDLRLTPRIVPHRTTGGKSRRPEGGMIVAKAPAWQKTKTKCPACPIWVDDLARHTAKRHPAKRKAVSK